jgi:hypothetical protein
MPPLGQRVRYLWKFRNQCSNQERLHSGSWILVLKEIKDEKCIQMRE